jgi:autophagy-related protein 2
VLPEADQQILRDLMSDAMEEIDLQQASAPVGPQANGEEGLSWERC